jgi:hypothetical protein
VTRGSLGVFRALALIAVATGALGSMGLMLFAGSRQRSLVLIGLFTGWVLSPFAALAWAAVVSKGWPSFERSTLYSGILILTLASLLLYSGLIPMPAGSRPAAVFLVVPAGSWVLIALAALLGRRLLARRV